MPIRFVCPHCHQRLSVSTRKAGTEAQCPRCRAAVTIPPTVDEQDAEPAAPSDALAGSFLVGEPIFVEPLVPEPMSAAPMIVEPEALPAIDPPPRADEVQKRDPAILEPATLEATSTVLVPPIAAPMTRKGGTTSQPVASDSVVVSRFVIYAQGGLLAAVALGSLIIGILLGRTFAPRPASKDTARECTVSGSVTYTTGPRTRPDRGAVVVLIPFTADAAGERAPVAGLRPSDPPPAADHPGLGVIRQLGGSYLRAGLNGRFETRVPAGRYWLLVISHQKRADAVANPGDVRTLGRYIENAADLVEDCDYRLTQEVIADDARWTVEFAGDSH